MRLSRRLALSGVTVAAALGRRAHAATPTVRIGVLTDLSGQYRDNSGPTTVSGLPLSVVAPGLSIKPIVEDGARRPDCGDACPIISRLWPSCSDAGHRARTSPSELVEQFV